MNYRRYPDIFWQPVVTYGASNESHLHVALSAMGHISLIKATNELTCDCGVVCPVKAALEHITARGNAYAGFLNAVAIAGLSSLMSKLCSSSVLHSQMNTTNVS